jgi:signal peptidase I
MKENSWIDVVKTFAWALLIATIFRTFLFQPFHIPSGSMKPTLLIGDFVIASQYSYGYSKHSFPFVSLPLFDGRIWYDEPKRGDVVIFKVPSKNFGEDVMIKRLVGLPNDKMQMIAGVLHINGVAVGLVDNGTFLEGIRSLKQQTETLPNGVSHEVLDAEDNFITDNTEVYSVPEGQFFMMGDNRDNSQDSRFDIPGFIPAENLIARAEFVLLSSEGILLNPFKWRSDRFFTSLRN